MGLSPRHSLKPPHVFPLAIAILSVTALVAVNPDEGIRLANLTWPFGLALVTIVIGWALGCLLASRRTAQSLIAGVFVASFLMGGYLYGWVAHVDSDDRSPLQLLLAVIVLVTVVLVVRKRERLESFGHFLDVTTAVLFLLTVPSVLRLVKPSDIEPPRPLVEPGMQTVPKPDIYLVVLDAYSGAASLSSVYDYDNGPMLDSLRSRGFHIPSAATSNYTKTFLSVGSMLNRAYPEALVEAAAPEYSDRRSAYEAMEYNQSMVDLQHLGYAIHYIGSSYPPMATNRLAEGPHSPNVSREFEALWLSTTLLPALVATWCYVAECKEAGGPFEAEDAASTETRIARFMRSASRPSPKFVFMHLLLPHGPFRFGPACEHRPGVWMTGPTAVHDSTGRRLYVEQVRCTNAKILEMVDHVRRVSGDSAVIMLQSDHGHGRFPGGVPHSIDRSSSDQIQERFDVFAAYYAPGDLADSLALVRTPVNLFRTLFRVLWNLQEAPLPDLHFWSDPDRPLLPIPVEVDALQSP